MQGQKPGFLPGFETGTSDMLIAVAENCEMTSLANSKTEVTFCYCRRLENFINMELIFQDYIGIQATQEPFYVLCMLQLFCYKVHSSSNQRRAVLKGTQNSCFVIYLITVFLFEILFSRVAITSQGK